MLDAVGCLTALACAFSPAPGDTLLALPISPPSPGAPRTVEVSLTAAPARASLLPDLETDVFA